MRYGSAIAKRLRKTGCEVILTTRQHPDALALAELLGEKPVVVGKYASCSLSMKLKASAKRILLFAEMFKDAMPDFAVSHQSVELCRTAFGLGIPAIVTADTPHAEAVNRLTVPLATKLVVSEAVPPQFYKKYGAREIVRFKGVDEVAWIRDFKPSKDLGFKHPLIVVRQIESGASYAWRKEDITLKLARRLSLLGNVVFLSRYSKKKLKNLTVLNKFVDSVSLVAHADLVVSVGGTISREAALQGVPSIVTSEICRAHVNTYLARKGFPLFIVEPSKVVSYAKKFLGKKFDVKTKLAALEDPVEVIERLVARKTA